MTHIVKMMNTCKYVVAICCMISATLLLSSCHDESHYLGSEDDRNANGFYIDGVRTHIEKAGFFYDEEKAGYNLFFSATSEDLYKGLARDVASRKFLSIDLPASQLGKRATLNASINDGDPNHYKFQLSTDHVPGFTRIMTNIETIKGGYVEFHILDEWVNSYDKKVKFDLRVEINNGRVIEANYKGAMQICQNYIGWWDRE